MSPFRNVPWIVEISASVGDNECGTESWLLRLPESSGRTSRPARASVGWFRVDEVAKSQGCRIVFAQNDGASSRVYET